MSRTANYRSLDGWEMAVAASAGILAAGVLLALFLAEGPVRYTLLGAVVVSSAFALCGNVRLGMLWALVITAPLGLCKRFVVTPNMGGAAALQFDVMDLFLFPLAFLLLREFQLRIRHRSELFVPVFAKWWLALMGFGCLTLIIGPYRHLAFFELFRMFKLVLLSLVIANEVSRRRQFRHLAAAMLASVVIQSLVAALQYILQHPLGLEVLGEASLESVDQLSKGTLVSKAFVYRVGGLLGHPNFLSTFLGAQLPIGFALLMTRAPLRLRVLGATALGLGSVALVLTLSRTGWIAAASALAGVLILSNLHPMLRARFQLGRVMLILGAGTVALAFSGKIYSRLYQSDEGAVDFRWELLEVAWNMGKSSPIIGRGLNSFVFQMPAYSKYGTKEAAERKFGNVLPVVHDVYALEFAEQGVIGFVLFLGFALSLLIGAIRNLKSRDDELFALGLAGVMGVAAFLVDWIASFTIRSDGTGRVCFVVFGLVAAVQRARLAETAPKPRAVPAPAKAPELAAT